MLRERERERELREKERRIPSRGSPDPRSLSLDHRSLQQKLERRDSERSRSRSRSPVRNGPSSVEHKVDGLYGKDVRVKEERKDDLADKKSELLKNSMLHPGFAGLIPTSMLDHRLLGLYPPPSSMASSVGLPPQAPALWPPLDLNHHRLELQREMEREKEQMLRRFGASAPSSSEQLHQELLLRQRLMEQQHQQHEKADAKLPPPPLRPSDMYRPPHSPLVSSSKSNSPASVVGAPPPLISSGAGSHSNSPVIKTKPAASPLATHPGSSNNSSGSILSQDKDATPNGHDAELQSR